jgi:hypothetical protein
MAYSNSQKNQAYRTYVETGSIEATANILNIPVSNLWRWHGKYDWKERALADRARLKPADIDKEMVVVQDIYEDLTQEDMQVLKDIKIIEATCRSALQGTQDIEDAEERKGVLPKSFKEVVDAYKACWGARDAIFNKCQRRGGENIQNNIEGETTVNIINAVDLNNEDTTKTRVKLVEKPVKDSE